MTAPNPPTIFVRHDGIAVYVRWQPVEDATDYNLYFAEGQEAYGIEEQFADDDVEEDGWFFYISAPYSGLVNVKMTALNVLAEESADSNVVQANLSGAGGEVHATPALRHAMRGHARS